jgi:hypothetical protein
MKTYPALLLALLIAASSVAVFAQPQSKSLPNQPKPLLKRTTYKTDKFDFGVGGTLIVSGAPVGSIRIEGWANREIEISAEIQVEASTEADLVRLSEITTFALEESLGRTEIASLGTHDKKYMKQVGKKFPKQLLGLPFRIDYTIKVPQFTDLQIDGGRGDLWISGVEGTFRLNYVETNAKVDMKGGGVIAIFGKGTVDLSVPTSSRGRFADVQLATGDLNVHLPNGMNAELDATILRTGKIENEYAGLKPRVRKNEFTDKSMVAKSGAGGITLKFIVGDGTLKIVPSGG